MFFINSSHEEILLIVSKNISKKSKTFNIKNKNKKFRELFENLKAKILKSQRAITITFDRHLMYISKEKSIHVFNDDTTSDVYILNSKSVD